MRIFRSDRERRIPAPVILIIPGGGYDRLTDTEEQSPVAEYFSRTLHVTAVVLYYRLAQKDGSYRYPVPMWDGQRAVKLLRFEAPQLGIDPERIALFGFSAGGHLASTLALHPAADFGLTRRDEVDRESGRPTLLGLGYPVISMDPADVPSSGSYRNLLRGYEGAELRELQNYLSGEKNVTARMAPVFLFESLDDAVSALPIVNSLSMLSNGKASRRTHICSRTESMASGLRQKSQKNMCGLNSLGAGWQHSIF